MARTGTGAWDYRVAGTDLATLSLPDLVVQSIRPVPAAPGVAWGSALMETRDHTYVYGIHRRPDGTPYLHVARTTSDLEAPWEYLSAGGWTTDPAASADQLPGISSQISVLPVEGGYALITQETGLGPRIDAYTAPSPAGPWSSPATVVATASPPMPGTFTYNAVAHPEYGAADRLLLSYNVNSLDPADAMIDAAIYHPRFLSIPWPPVGAPAR